MLLGVPRSPPHAGGGTCEPVSPGQKGGDLSCCRRLPREPETRARGLLLHGAHTLPVGGNPHCVLGTTLGPVAHRDREREVSQLGILQKLT